MQVHSWPGSGEQKLALRHGLFTGGRSGEGGGRIQSCALETLTGWRKPGFTSKLLLMTTHHPSHPVLSPPLSHTCRPVEDSNQSGKEYGSAPPGRGPAGERGCSECPCSRDAGRALPVVAACWPRPLTWIKQRQMTRAQEPTHLPIFQPTQKRMSSSAHTAVTRTLSRQPQTAVSTAASASSVTRRDAPF